MAISTGFKTTLATVISTGNVNVYGKPYFVAMDPEGVKYTVETKTKAQLPLIEAEVCFRGWTKLTDKELDNGAVIKTDNGSDWYEVTPRPVVAGVHLTCVWMKDENTWLIGTSNGRLYCTHNAGDTWEQKTFSGSGTGKVWDIVFSTDSIGYMSHAIGGPAGRIFRTYNAGQSWKILPEGTGTLAANDRITSLATCEYNPNFIVGGGLADNGTDGILLLGQD